MAQSPSPPVTQLLADWRGGNPDALEALLPLVYEELKKVAVSYMRVERPNHTLQPTALVHEAYMRLAGQHVDWQNRAHFYGVAAQLMRRILVDHARRRKADKRGGEFRLVALDHALEIPASPKGDVNMVELDKALTRLEQIDPRQARIVELRYFSGLTIEQTGEFLNLSPTTVKREWTMARTWLKREIIQGSGS